MAFEWVKNQKYFIMNKFKSSALKILKESGKPLHYKEITRLALEKGFLKTDGKTPESSMNAQLITDVNNNGVNSDFIKTAPATFDINQNKPKKNRES